MYATNPPSVPNTPAPNTPRAITQSLPRRWLAAASAQLWHWLRRPWLAIMAGIISVMLALAVSFLPQLPGQLIDEQAAAATWLLNASTAYGIWGNPFLALGIFDVLRSPLLFLLLALLLPTLAAQLADQIGALRQLRGVQHYALTTPTTASGEPILTTSVRHLYRWRGTVNAEPSRVATTLASKAQADFALIKQAQAPISTAPLTTTLSTPAEDAEGNENGNESDTTLALPKVETRIVATRFPRLQYLRPLLMIGLLIAVAGAWTALAFGWQVTAPPLAPGGVFRSANRNLVLHYSVAITDTLNATLDATLQGEKVTLPANQTLQQRVGLASIQTRPSYPAIWIATADGDERLTLPGEAELRASIGLVFADPGSEESILIPDQSSGLRIVQLSGTDGFVLELYRSDAIQPVYRAELTKGGQLTLPFGPGDTALVITTLPGLQVDIRHLPGLWIVPLGILFAFLGAVAFLRPSAFAIIQIAPWATDHTVVVLQSDHANVITDLRATLAALTPPVSEVGDSGDQAHPAPLTTANP